jgi:hypothetical protein
MQGPSRLTIAFQEPRFATGDDDADDIELRLESELDGWRDFGGEALEDLWRCPRDEVLARDLCVARAQTKGVVLERAYGAVVCALPLLDAIETDAAAARDPGASPEARARATASVAARTKELLRTCAPLPSDGCWFPSYLFVAKACPAFEPGIPVETSGR